jgi:hypothetical protein
MASSFDTGRSPATPKSVRNWLTSSGSIVETPFKTPSGIKIPAIYFTKWVTKVTPQT